jgi:hypothetical protein
MTTEQIMKELEKKGSESIRKFSKIMEHRPMYGVKIAI